MSTHALELSAPILAKNDRLAQENRTRLSDHGIYMIDLMSSPGSGKTSTICATIHALKDRYRIAVIEGDIASDVDAQTIKALGIPSVQINTGGLCHLESNMIKQALDVLDLSQLDLIFIENVGNLVCPVDFDLGEDEKVMILSVPEGDDKPLKYPGIFQAARALVVNKIDTLPVFDFDKDAYNQAIDRLNPHAPRFFVSATKGDGIDAWIAYLQERIEKKKQGLACV